MAHEAVRTGFSRRTATVMRQVLFYIPLKGNWSLGPLGEVPGFGFGIVLLIWCLFSAVSLYRTWQREKKLSREMISSLMTGVGFALGIVLVPHFAPVDRLPVFGYGTMLVLACLASGFVAARRSRLAGVEPQFSADLAVVMVLAGVVGARLFHLIQYRERVFGKCETLKDYLVAVVNLPDGGLVLYGGIMFASVVYVVVCRKRGISPLRYADAVIPAVFVGIAFGRMGCFLNGCCFGDPTGLPWGVSFPKDSVPWQAYVQRGLLAPDAVCTAPLHPTQLYSVVDGLLLALITTLYYKHRRGDGSVVALGAIAYSITRFTIEVLRNDEPGRLGTGFTISQLISFGILTFGLTLAWWSHVQMTRRRDAPAGV